MKPETKIVLIRHAQKDFLPLENPILNDKGFLQAEKLCDLVKKNTLPQPTDLWCSDFIRTRQTLEKIANQYQLKPVVHTELNLRKSNESAADFRHRLEKLVRELSNPEPSSANRVQKNIYLCTHFDVIEELMSLIPSDTDLSSSQYSHWSPAQFVVFKVIDQIWVVQKTGEAHHV